jgi:hypothetical protein
MKRMKLYRSTAIAAAVLCLGTTGCMPRATPVLVTPDYEATVRTIGLPPTDRARLYIVSGKTPSGSLFGPAYRLHDISGDIYVDGVKIGSLNPKEIMVADVVPGKHVLYWHYLNQSGGPLLRSDRLELDLQGGTSQMLGTDIGTFNLTITQGSLYTRDNPSPATNTVPAMFKIVRPGSCPPTICL